MFLIANAARMQGRRRLNLRRDPPPDPVIEIDDHGSLDRLSIYAALKVPEVWRLQGDQLIFYVLGNNGKFAEAATSQSFPLVTPADLLRFIVQARELVDHNPILRQFRQWIRERRSV